LASNKLQSVSFNQAAAVSTAVFGMSGKLTLLPLSIVQQPATNNACVGDVALFAIGVDHPVLASYQWQRQSPGQTNFISVAFATNSSYTTQPLTTFDDNAAFRVVVSGPLNVVTSTPAFLRVFPSSPASPLFSFDFTSLPTNSAIYGSAYLDNTNGVLVLTSGDTNQTGALIIADPVPGQVVRAFSASFKAQISPGTAIPGSGFSFNWATNIPNGTWPTAENGVGNGLSIAFDIYDNGGNEAPAIDVKWYGAVIAHQLVSSNLLITGTDFARVFIRLNSDDTLDVLHDVQRSEDGWPLSLRTGIVADLPRFEDRLVGDFDRMSDREQREVMRGVLARATEKTILEVMERLARDGDAALVARVAQATKSTLDDFDEARSFAAKAGTKLPGDDGGTRWPRYAAKLGVQP